MGGVTTQGIGATEACDLTGVSYRNLDYWTRTGLMTPSVLDADGSGTQRGFSEDDVARLAVIRRLRDMGFELPRIRAVLGEGSDPDWRKDLMAWTDQTVADLMDLVTGACAG